MVPNRQPIVIKPSWMDRGEQVAAELEQATAPIPDWDWL